MTTHAPAFPGELRKPGQIQGWSCALCGKRLYKDRSLGEFIVRTGVPGGEVLELWACLPPCKETPLAREVARLNGGA